MVHRAEKQKERPKQHDENAIAHLHGAGFLVSGATPLDQVVHGLDVALATPLAAARKTNFGDAIPAEGAPT